MYLLEWGIDWGPGFFGWVKGVGFTFLGIWIVYRIAISYDRQQTTYPLEPPKSTYEDSDKGKDLGYYDDEHNY